MPQEMKMIEAIKIAIQTEKDVMDFYLKAAAITENERGKKVFEQLAREEREHAGHFFKIYTGRKMLAVIVNNDPGTWIFRRCHHNFHGVAIQRICFGMKFNQPLAAVKMEQAS